MLIGELATRTGTTAKTLRFYEQAGLLPAAERTSAGYRDYGPDAAPRIDFVHRGQAAGLTLAQIRQILEIRESGDAPCGHVRDLLDTRLADIDDQIRKLRELRRTVARLRENADEPDPVSCGSEQVCRYL